MMISKSLLQKWFGVNNYPDIFTQTCMYTHTHTLFPTHSPTYMEVLSIGTYLLHELYMTHDNIKNFNRLQFWIICCHFYYNDILLKTFNFTSTTRIKHTTALPYFYNNYYYSWISCIILIKLLALVNHCVIKANIRYKVHSFKVICAGLCWYRDFSVTIIMFIWSKSRTRTLTREQYFHSTISTARQFIHINHCSVTLSHCSVTLNV